MGVTRRMEIKRTETFSISVNYMSDLERGIAAIKSLAGDAKVVKFWFGNSPDRFAHSLEVTVEKPKEIHRYDQEFSA